VILAKKPEAKAPVEKVMQTNLGEISRHLAGTTIGHRADDIQFSRRTTRSCRCAAAFGKTPCACWIRRVPTASYATSSR
jgi:hypothetical protein